MFRTSEHPNFTGHSWSCWASARPENTSSALVLPSYGRTQCNGHFRMEQILTYHAFHIFSEGMGIFELNGHPYSLQPGQMVIVRPGDHARYFDKPESPWRYQWFILKGTHVPSVLKEAGVSEHTSVLEGDWPTWFSEVFGRLEDAYRAESVSPLRATAFAWETVAILAEHCDSGNRIRTDTLADRARFLMEQDYHSGLQVEDVAGRLGVSRATLFRQFRDAFGSSPKVYLDDVRLTQAHNLLLRTRSSVKEIAFACGFQNPQYFSRVYKKRYGSAPSKVKQDVGVEK